MLVVEFARIWAVFAAQVSYLVTGFGILWAKLLLGESYSSWVCAALALMMRLLRSISFTPYVIYRIILGLILQVFPLPQWADQLRPQWPLLILIYWSMALPERAGIFTALIVGLIVDGMLDDLLGQHALAYALAIYIVMTTYKRLRLTPMWQQAVAVFLLLMIERKLGLSRGPQAEEIRRQWPSFKAGAARSLDDLDGRRRECSGDDSDSDASRAGPRLEPRPGDRGPVSSGRKVDAQDPGFVSLGAQGRDLRRRGGGQKALPVAEVGQLAARDRDDDLPTHDLALHVGVGVVLSHVVLVLGYGLVRGELFEPFEVIFVQS